MRGPLDIVRATWIASKKSNENVISHVMSIRENIEQMLEVAQQNLKRAQEGQKKWKVTSLDG